MAKMLLKKLYNKYQSSGAVLLLAVLVASVINLLFNVFTSRVLTFEAFGLLTLLNTFLLLLLIPLNALAVTINHHIAYHTGKEGKKFGQQFLNSTRKKVVTISVIMSILWIVLSPLINTVFHINELLVPLLFSPIIFFGAIAALNRGFLQGSYNFNFLSLLLIFEALSKIGIAWLLVFLNLHQWVYVSIPLSVFISYFISDYLVNKKVTHKTITIKSAFPKKFFTIALISGIASIAFLSFDLLLAKHFLSQEEAGQYALLSLIGKMVYFFGILPSYLMVTFISSDEGNNRNPRLTFYKIFAAALILTTGAFIAVTLFGKFLLPLIFGNKVFVILPYLNLYASGIALLTLSATITSFHIAKKQYFFPIVSIFMAILMSGGILFFHENIYQITQVIFGSSFLSFVLTIVLHIFEANKNISFKGKVVPV